MDLEFTISNRKKEFDSIGVYYDFDWESIAYSDGINTSEGFIRNINISDVLKEAIKEIDDIGVILWESVLEDGFSNEKIKIEFYYQGFKEDLIDRNLINEWETILSLYSISEAFDITGANEDFIISEAEEIKEML